MLSLLINVIVYFLGISKYTASYVASHSTLVIVGFQYINA